MKTTKRRGRPRKSSRDAKSEYLDVRLEASEKQAFKDAAAVAGLALATWVRERLRRAARTDLEDAGRQVAFMLVTPEGE